MRPSQRKIILLGGAFVALQAVLVGFLAQVMLAEHDTWLVRSYRNRWSFRDTPTERGAIWDRFGEQPLAIDRAEFELLVHYQRFRRRHPVGCAIHGGELLREIGADRGAPFRFDAARGAGRGPREAFEVLGRLPLRALLETELIEDGELRQDLAFYTASMIASLSGRGIGAVRAEWRAALEADRGATVLAAAARGFELEAEFDRRHDELLRLEGVLDEYRPGRSVRLALGNEPPRLMNVLDVWREQSAEQRAKWEEHLETRERRAVLGLGWFDEADEGEALDSEGSGESHGAGAADGDGKAIRPREELLRKVAERVPFDVACAFEVASDRHPGLEMWAAARREHPGPESLRGILGSVADMDWVLAPEDGEAPDGEADAREAARRILERHRSELVLDGGWFSEDFGAKLEKEVQDYLTGSLLRRGRKGISGVEATLDDVLSGQPGLRLVQRDRYAREQALASSLDLKPGRDAALTLDLDLQRIAQAVARENYEALLLEVEAKHRDDPDHLRKARHYLETAIVVMDGRSGDLLALAGYPLSVETDEGDFLRGPAGVNWRGAGDIGSLAKAFTFVEVLEHRGEAGVPDERSFPLCRGRSCGHHHGSDAQSGVAALAQSCNVWFYEMANRGLGQRGVEHALQRFGLVKPREAAVRMAGGMGRVVAGSEVREGEVQLVFPPIAPEAWCPGVVGLGRAVVAPKQGLGSYPVRKQAIGYDMHASPVHVARAYAALATGALPTPSVILGPPRRSVDLGVRPETLAAVRVALRDVVEVGTAKRIPSLRRHGVHGKTGTAEITSPQRDNNAWFAGWAETADPEGPLPVFVAVAYWVPDGSHGGEVGGTMVGAVLDGIVADPELHARYPVAER